MSEDINHKNWVTRGVGGRPTKLTPEVKDKIIRYIRGGNYIETAVQASGITKKSFYNWLDRGNKELERLAKSPKARVRQSEQIFVDFVKEVDKAQAEAEAKDVMLLAEFAKEDSNVIRWRLERKYPQRWGNRQQVDAKVEHAGEVGLPKGLDADTAKEFASWLLKNKRSEDK